MLTHIVRKEILSALASPKFVFAFLLCTVLILLSFYTGIASHKRDLAEYRSAVALSRKQLESHTSWTGLFFADAKLSKPPEILSTIVSGIQNAVGGNLLYNYGNDPGPVDSKYENNPASAIFGPLDLTLIVKIVLSLLAILFSFDAISGERERGTLKLTLSNQLPRYQLILGKTIAGFVSLMLVLVIPFLVGLIFLQMSPVISLTGEDWIRLGLILLCFLLYLSVFLNLGLFISSRTRHASSSLLFLLLLWVLCIHIVPKVAVIVSKQVVSAPSIHVLNAEKHFAFHVLWHNKKGPEDLFAKVSAKNGELNSAYEMKHRRRQGLAFNLSRISPASCMTLGVLTLARTGVAEQERFVASARAYLPVYYVWAGKNRWDPRSRGEKPSLKDMPRFKYAPQALSDTLLQAMTDILVLVLMNAVLFASAYVSFLKYDVR